MAQPDLEALATPLVAAASRERHELLVATLGRIRAEWSKSGMFHSSTHYNAICMACTDALRNMADSIWKSIERAHKAQGSSSKNDLFAVFQKLLEAECAKLAAMQEQYLRPVRDSLQNTSLRQTSLLTDLYAELLMQYQAEAQVYLGNLKHGPGTSQFEILKHQFLNNRLFAALAIVVAALSALGLIDVLARASGLLRALLD